MVSYMYAPQVKEEQRACKDLPVCAYMCGSAHDCGCVCGQWQWCYKQLRFLLYSFRKVMYIYVTWRSWMGCPV